MLACAKVLPTVLFQVRMDKSTLAAPKLSVSRWWLVPPWCSSRIYSPPPVTLVRQYLSHCCACTRTVFRSKSWNPLGTVLSGPQGLPPCEASGQVEAVWEIWLSGVNCQREREILPSSRRGRLRASLHCFSQGPEAVGGLMASVVAAVKWEHICNRRQQFLDRNENFIAQNKEDVMGSAGGGKQMISSAQVFGWEHQVFEREQPTQPTKPFYWILLLLVLLHFQPKGSRRTRRVNLGNSFKEMIVPCQFLLGQSSDQPFVYIF